MKASIKTLIATTLLSSAFVAGNASAGGGFDRPSFGGHDGHPAPYQQADRYQRPDFRYNDMHAARYIDQMQARQRLRIEQGIRSGDLTRREARRLMTEQWQIERMQRQYMADNRLNPFERQRLMVELEQASRDIWREKNDAQERNDFRPARFAYR